MATIPENPPTQARQRRFRWTREQYYAIAELGFFRDRRVELINGEILTMTINPPHAICLELVTDQLYRIFKPGFRIRIQSPLDLGRRNQPEPDAMVLADEGRIELAHPTTALLVVEVSDTTLRMDRTIKPHLYAQAGIQDYWIVNLVDRQVEVHRSPGLDPSRRGRFRYADVTVVAEAGRMAPLAAPGLEIAVAAILPPKATTGPEAPN